MPRTVAQLYIAYVGKRVAFDVGQGVEVACKVVDAAMKWGTERLLIQPVCGVGSRWTTAAMCRVVSDHWPEDSDAPAEHDATGADRVGAEQAAPSLPAAGRRTGIVGSLPGRVPSG